MIGFEEKIDIKITNIIVKGIAEFVGDRTISDGKASLVQLVHFNSIIQR